MNKKADIWVSAVLYIALGVIVITLILAAGVPLINKMRDKNTLSQTKLVMAAINDNIKLVSNEGPGSRRVLSPLNIDTGELTIDPNDIYWTMLTKNKLMEPGINFTEGSLIIHLEPTNIEDEYKLYIEMDYSNNLDIELKSTQGNPFTGTYSMAIEHTGEYPNNLPKISIDMS